jgi:hypothetical protein
MFRKRKARGKIVFRIRSNLVLLERKVEYGWVSALSWNL